MSADVDTIQAFIEGNGYEVLTLSDGSRSAFPIDTAEPLAALARLADAEVALRAERMVSEWAVAARDKAQDRAAAAEAQRDTLAEAHHEILALEARAGQAACTGISQRALAAVAVVQGELTHKDDPWLALAAGPLTADVCDCEARCECDDEAEA